MWRCPTVRFLDYKKVKDAERQKAAELFGTATEPTSLASQVCLDPHRMLTLGADHPLDYWRQVQDFRHTIGKRLGNNIDDQESAGEADG